MAKKRTKPTSGDTKTAAYRHTGERRTNIPPAKIAAEGKVPRVPRVRYHYSPHLSPVLRSDPTGNADALQDLVAAAGRRSLTEAEQEKLANALRDYQPWLEWTGKQEQQDRSFFELDPVALHIHERVSAEAIVRTAQRVDVQRDLFADPQQSYAEAVQFYRHHMDWTNRLILGDSLAVMASLARREQLEGAVQAIYMDPPYGVNFRSNFQPLVRTRTVGELEGDLTREAEVVRAFRDTWVLGVHSYLTYLRNRLIACRTLLRDTGSIFVQISDDRVHLVRALLDDVFGPDNFISQIAFTKGPGGLSRQTLAARHDYLLWYSRSAGRAMVNRVFPEAEADPDKFTWIQFPNGRVLRANDPGATTPPKGARYFTDESLTKPGPGSKYDIDWCGETFDSGRRWWGTPKDALLRALRAERVFIIGNTLRRKKFQDESIPKPLDNLWTDVGGPSEPMFVVQTNETVVARCLQLASKPGDLVLDPTCGSGTTAYVAERLGRRWITIDTSRVAVALARQRLLTAAFPLFRTCDGSDNPAAGFVVKRARNVTMSSVSQNARLDPIIDRFRGPLEDSLTECNKALMAARAIGRSEASLARLPVKLTHCHMPVEPETTWPGEFASALRRYETLRIQKLAALDGAIKENAEDVELSNLPEEVRGARRVTGPFTVEGVRPEEISLSEERTTEGLQGEELTSVDTTLADVQNVRAHLAALTSHLRNDGVTFLDNSVHSFTRLESLFDGGSASVLHAEGEWLGEGRERRVAVTFGPDSGPVTALQVEDAIREARQYDDLVIAGFSFDAEATAVVAEQSHPKLRIHQAFIRPDLNSAMEGLLKDTPRSQLFTVFGQPELEVKERKAGWVVTLTGVDIYNPVENTVRSTGADKVAAWFLDSDFDGRCFCITQAFFPDQNAWDKIAKALGSSADPEAFEKLKGTTSLPFSKGKYGRIAVKVIDPRGNEVMAIRKLS